MKTEQQIKERLSIINDMISEDIYNDRYDQTMCRKTRALLLTWVLESI